MPVTIDWSDPNIDACTRANYLRQAYMAVVEGRTERSIRYRGPKGEEEVRFQNASKEDLLALLRAAEQECAQLTGGNAASRRFAMRAGSRRVIVDPFVE